MDWLKKKDAAGNDLDPDALERAHKACMQAVTFSYVNVDSTEYVLFVVPAHLDATFVVHMPFSSNRYIPVFFHPSPTRSQRLCERVPTPLFIIFLPIPTRSQRLCERVPTTLFIPNITYSQRLCMP